MAKKILDQILDPDNTEPLVVYGENGDEIRMEQIAVIPIAMALYLIAQPIDDPIVADDEAIVFEVITDEDTDEILKIVEDEQLVDAVFNHYYAILEELNADDDDLF